MVNDFRDKVNWPAYYREIAKEEYNPDYHDGAVIGTEEAKDARPYATGTKRTGAADAAKNGREGFSGKREIDGVHGNAGRPGAGGGAGRNIGQRSDGAGDGEGGPAHSENSLSQNAERQGLTGKFSQDLEELDALRKENERLKNRVEHWKGQLRQTTPETRSVRQGDIDRLARQLVKDFGGTLKASDISGRLKALGDLIVRGGDG